MNIGGPLVMLGYFISSQFNIQSIGQFICEWSMCLEGEQMGKHLVKLNTNTTGER